MKLADRSSHCGNDDDFVHNGLDTKSNNLQSRKIRESRSTLSERQTSHYKMAYTYNLIHEELD